MKAIRMHDFGGPEVLQLEEVPGLKPGPGQVVVRVRAIGVNPVETYIRSGAYHMTPRVPFTPGTDAAGVVEAIGEGVGGVHPGDRVYTTGTLSGSYAEQVLCDLSQAQPLPERVSFAQGAGVNIPCSAAYRALFQRAHAVAGESVLIHGATGGVGIAAVQLARAAGMRVLATGGTAEGRRLAAQQGAHRVIDHHAAAHFQEVLEATDGQGVDVIVELLANVNLGKDLELLSRGGRVVIVGSRGPVEINPRDAMVREAAILGMLLFNASERELFGIHAALNAGLANGTLCPVVGKELPLAQASTAHREVVESASYGKIVLVP
jgi:NADPH2:quinone reductase